MTWWAIDVRTAPEERERLGAWLVARTGQAVEERDDGTLVTFAPDERDGRPADRRAGARGRGAGRDQPSADRAGGLVHPLARRPRPPALRPAHGGAVLGTAGGDRTVRSSCSIPRRPSAAASTAPPGSRSRCWSGCVRPGDCVLDLGSGSGILAIAAVKLGAARAVGIESDAEANLVAARNAERNGVAGGGRVPPRRRRRSRAPARSRRPRPLQHPPPRQHRAPAGDRGRPPPRRRRDLLRHGGRGGAAVPFRRSKPRALPSRTS